MSRVARAVVYPESDGKPMAENTLQYQWIVTLRENIRRVRPNDLVAADNFVYPVEGNPRVVQAPDVYVALGRPPGHRPSYRVWEEGGVFPQVVFEVLSPGNRGAEMVRKFRFYDRYGAAEYYLYDPDSDELTGWVRDGACALAEIPDMHGFVSPRLGIRFDTSGGELVVYGPDGRPFRTVEQIMADEESAEAGRQEAEADLQRAEADRDRLKAMLRAAGIDPDTGG